MKNRVREAFTEKQTPTIEERVAKLEHCAEGFPALIARVERLEKELGITNEVKEETK